MAIKEVDPISRIEGHLGVKLTVNDGTGLVDEANVHGNLWRGFENFLIGRDPNDAITFTQRICGVCPVPHGQTSTFAVEAAMGYNDGFHTFNTESYAVAGKGIPKKAVHIRNLVLGCEFLMSSMTHFYHLAAPSYVQGPNMAPWTPYFADAFYSPLLRSAGHGTSAVLPAESKSFSTDLWSAVIKQYVKALRIRRLTFEAGALFAGRMPMTSCFVAGGVSFQASEDLNVVGGKCDKFKSMLDEIGTFVVREYVPLVLALGALYGDFDNPANSGFNPAVDKATMLTNGVRVGKGYGGGVGNFLAWGGFPKVGALGVQDLTLPRGYKHVGDATIHPITVADVQTNLRESVYSSHYASAGETGFTGTDSEPLKVIRTVPDRSVGYSWLKSPRWGGLAMEVGPFARLVVAGLYPVDGTDIAAGGLSAYYLLYTKNGGLDPKMVEPDLAVALLREGLATLTIDGSGTAIMATSDTFTTNAAASNIVVKDHATSAVYVLDTDYTVAAGVVTWINVTTTEVDITWQVVVTSDAGLATANDIATAYYGDNTKITGIVADWIIGLSGGLSTMDRLRARALESLYLMVNMIGAPAKVAQGINWPGTSGWIKDLKDLPDGAATFAPKDYPVGGSTGTFGATEAPRGALLHTCSIDTAGKISAYQCVVPTTWNASPKSTAVATSRGPIEQAMIGIPYAADTKTIRNQANTADIVTEGGVEALRVAQSFDPCIACAVH